MKVKNTNRFSAKHVRKITVFALVLSIVVACFAACGKTTDGNALTKIADHLYEIYYTEDFDWAKEEAPNYGAFACSGVQNGQYRGRNYDLVYNDSDICVIHASATANRPHASVGVIDFNFCNGGSRSCNLDAIPFATVDGINDAGVCIQANVLPYGENGVINHTATTSDDLSAISVVRYILDNASSVQNAISLLEAKDIHPEMDYFSEAHWMLSGPESDSSSEIKTVVIEVFPDGLHVTEDFVDGKPIMTNFNISNFDGSVESIGFGIGYERWEILNKYYDQANSVMGTFDLMEKVFYSNFYDLYGDEFWYSDFNGTDLSDYYSADELKALLGQQAYDDNMDAYGGVYYNPTLFDGAKALGGDIAKAGIIQRTVLNAAEAYKEQNMQSGHLWITIHTAVYDLANLTLDIQVREAQDHYHFTIK